MSTVVSNLRFAWYYVRANLSMAMEYRGSFLTQVFGMVLNNTLWAVFWWLFFQNFPRIEGWSYSELLLLYAVVAIGFALALGLMGNCNSISRIIAEGHLDFYLAQPKPVLLHILVSRMDVSAWGDLVFGVLVYGISGAVSWYNTLLLITASVLTGAIFVFFGVAVHSISFYIGNSATMAAHLFNALITFAMYPNSMFRGSARILLFTVIPAGLITWVPTEIIRLHRIEILLAMAGGAVLLGLVAITLFYRGLRRYESGNLISVRV
ncbi:MAG: hypothetical protein GX030_08965 [Firmicutes bacterium]|nr:hypothetical protein [Bacillota bacterium]